MVARATSCQVLTGNDRRVNAVAVGALPDGTPVIVARGGREDDGLVRVCRLAEAPRSASAGLPESVRAVAVHGNVIVTAVGASIAVHQPAFRDRDASTVRARPAPSCPRSGTPTRTRRATPACSTACSPGSGPAGRWPRSAERNWPACWSSSGDETAARASEMLALNIEDPGLDARRAPIRSKAANQWICRGSGTAHLLPRLIPGRHAGPVLLSGRPPAPPAAPQPRTCARPPDGPGSATTAPGSCSPGTPGGSCTGSATPRPLTCKGAELHRMHHSAVRVNMRCLRRSVRPRVPSGCPAYGAAAVTWDFTVRLDLMQR